MIILDFETKQTTYNSTPDSSLCMDCVRQMHRVFATKPLDFQRPAGRKYCPETFEARLR